MVLLVALDGQGHLPPGDHPVLTEGRAEQQAGQWVSLEG